MAAAVAQRLPHASIRRIGGTDRFATSAAVAEHWSATGGRVYVAAGHDFPDALAGVPAAARVAAPLALTRKRCLPASVEEQVDRLAPEQVVVLGGTGAVDERAITRTCGS